MSAPLTIGVLLRHAETYLDGDRSTSPDAAFAAALLTRESLELALVAWARASIGISLKGVNGRAQLAVVEEHLRDAALGRRARFVWNALSATLHHGPAGADPATVRRLAVETEAVVGGLAADVAERRSSSTRENARANDQDRT